MSWEALQKYLDPVTPGGGVKVLSERQYARAMAEAARLKLTAGAGGSPHPDEIVFVRDDFRDFKLEERDRSMDGYVEVAVDP